MSLAGFILRAEQSINNAKAHYTAQDTEECIKSLIECVSGLSEALEPPEEQPTEKPHEDASPPEASAS